MSAMTLLYRIRKTGGLVMKYEVIRIVSPHPEEVREERIGLFMTRRGAERAAERAWLRG